MISLITRRLLGGLLATAAISGAFLTSANQGKQAFADSNKKILAVGSTALQPLAQQVGEKYQDKHPSTQIQIQGGGSGSGLTQISNDSVQIGNSDIFANQQKGINPNKIKDHKVAAVGFAPVVNKSVKVKNLTKDQLQGIFSGKIKNWKQVGGKNKKITVVNRANGSGTRVTFDDNVMGNQKPKTTQEQDSNGTVQKVVRKTPGSISYLSFYYIHKKGIKPIKLNQVKPINKNITNNKWPIWSYEHMYTKNKPSSSVKKYIKTFHKESTKDDIKKLGYIPLSSMKVTKNSNNQVTKK